MTQAMTHDALVTAAAKWLRKKHPIVLSDVRCAVTSEQPDVIGWTNGGFSSVVECKVSRADFARDEKKWFRRSPENGMGYYRWIAAPAELLRAEDVPEKWGLVVMLWARGRMSIVRQAEPFYQRNDQSEKALLVNALRRATEGWGRRMFFEDGDPHPTASKIIRELRAEVAQLRTAKATATEGRTSEDMPGHVPRVAR